MSWLLGWVKRKTSADAYWCLRRLGFADFCMARAPPRSLPLHLSHPPPRQGSAEGAATPRSIGRPYRVYPRSALRDDRDGLFRISRLPNPDRMCCGHAHRQGHVPCAGIAQGAIGRQRQPMDAVLLHASCIHAALWHRYRYLVVNRCTHPGKQHAGKSQVSGQS